MFFPIVWSKDLKSQIWNHFHSPVEASTASHQSVADQGLRKVLLYTLWTHVAKKRGPVWIDPMEVNSPQNSHTKFPKTLPKPDWIPKMNGKLHQITIPFGGLRTFRRQCRGGSILGDPKKNQQTWPKGAQSEAEAITPSWSLAASLGGDWAENWTFLAVVSQRICSTDKLEVETKFTKLVLPWKLSKKGAWSGVLGIFPLEFCLPKIPCHPSSTAGWPRCGKQTQKLHIEILTQEQHPWRVNLSCHLKYDLKAKACGCQMYGIQYQGLFCQLFKKCLHF